jgi:hypothetical protein
MSDSSPTSRHVCFVPTTDPRRPTFSLLRERFPSVGTPSSAPLLSTGPERCSGLPVVRYDAASLGKTLGPAFRLIETRRHEHLTPMGAYSDSSSVGSKLQNSTRPRFRLRSFKSLPKQLLRGERKSPHRCGRLESAKSAQHIVGGLQWQIGNQIRAFTPRPAWP